jgi:hypothetical protein
MAGTKIGHFERRANASPALSNHQFGRMAFWEIKKPISFRFEISFTNAGVISSDSL